MIAVTQYCPLFIDVVTDCRQSEITDVRKLPTWFVRRVQQRSNIRQRQHSSMQTYDDCKSEVAKKSSIEQHEKISNLSGNIGRALPVA